MISTLLYYFVVLTILTLYLLLILQLRRGWKQLADFTVHNTGEELAVTVIIPFRNEAEALPQVLAALKNQTYQNFELILVDDHSTDDSAEIVSAWEQDFPQLRFLKNERKGKKHAIRTAVYAAKNELVVTLDADVHPGIDCLQGVVSFWQSENAELIISPVKMESDGSFLQNFQQLEFMSLVATGAGAAGVNKPILCNGANLAFTRTAWLESESELHFDVPSGDDVFLLQSIKRRGGKISFAKAKELIVSTSAQPGWRAFLSQRTRWASKHSMYSDKELAFTAIIVFLISFVLLVSLVLALFSTKFHLAALLIFIAKFGLDLYFLRSPAQFFEIKNLFVKTLLFSFVYPFYLTFTAISSMMQKNSGWSR